MSVARPLRFLQLWRPALLPAALAVVLLWLLGTAGATAEETLRGAALVIGNGDYERLAPLPNPPDDADAIEALLSDLGFDSVRRTDRDAEDLARDLERFAEDAEDADVAVLYYAGHGIEAGGENWLVPVDADISSLESAASSLVPVSGIIRRLRETVPVTIVLLDACRDSPFPPGATLKLAASADPVPVSVGGLSVPRGAGSLAKTAQSSGGDNLGIVIGFAAAPGKVALDGEKGGNSPYAAALTRHIAAMAGEEFGTVMRMVAEEVYLKTGGRQRPWVNENLRRLLFFGSAPEPVEGDEGDILKERRQLLLTIADLPDFERRQVERVAHQGDVPMDAVYGVLKALGKDTPDDPAELEELLRAQAEELKSFLSERRMVEDSDPELARLSRHTDEAVAEGALDTARRLRDAAHERIANLSSVIEREEELIRARRTEFAAEYARSARVAALDFDHLVAAAYYERAFREVERWDDGLAWRYKQSVSKALIVHGGYKEGVAALERAIDTGRQALDIARDSGRRHDVATTLMSLGRAFETLGRWRDDTALLEEAVGAQRAALDVFTREREPSQWADAQNRLGIALWSLAVRESGTARLREALAAFRSALQVRTRDRAPQAWAATQGGLAITLSILGQREDSLATLERAVDAHRAALEVYTPTRAPLERAREQSRLGTTLRVLAKRRNDIALLEEAMKVQQAALQEVNRDHTPLDWAWMQNNLGITLRILGHSEGSPARLEEAVEAYRAALLERTRERMPLDWARTQHNLGNALFTLGSTKDDAAILNGAARAYRAALEVRTRSAYPHLWKSTWAALLDALVELTGRGDFAAFFEVAATADLGDLWTLAAREARDLTEEIEWDVEGFRDGKCRRRQASC